MQAVNCGRHEGPCEGGAAGGREGRDFVLKTWTPKEVARSWGGLDKKVKDQSGSVGQDELEWKESGVRRKQLQQKKTTAAMGRNQEIPRGRQKDLANNSM